MKEKLRKLLFSRKPTEFRRAIDDAIFFSGAKSAHQLSDILATMLIRKKAPFLDITAEEGKAGIGIDFVSYPELLNQSFYSVRLLCHFEKHDRTKEHRALSERIRALL